MNHGAWSHSRQFCRHRNHEPFSPVSLTSEPFTSCLAGKWIAANPRRLAERENPGNLTDVASRWSMATPAEAHQAMEAAAQAHGHWSSHPIDLRIKLLAGWLSHLAAEKDRIAAVITRENGKTLAEAHAEIAAALADAQHSIGEAKSLGVIESTGRRSHLRLEPIGVCLLITPWNFPFATIVRKLTPALLYGNAVVVKPSELTPASAVEIVRPLLELGLPAGTVNLVLGTGSEVGAALVSHSSLRAVSFTGSTRTGETLARLTVARDVRLQLEMGGNNPLVVLDDADLDKAVEAAITGGFSCAGQWCTGTGRVIVMQSMAERFTDQLVARTERLRFGPGNDPTSDIGPVITGKSRDFARQSVAGAVASGARRRCGGATPPGGHFFTPCVLDHIQPSMPAFTDELFVPILPVITAATVDEAVKLANRGPYGLSASVFSRDEARGMQCAARIDAGMIHLNLHTAWRDPALPVSGWRESGRGWAECGRFYRDFFTRPRAVYLP